MKIDSTITDLTIEPSCLTVKKIYIGNFEFINNILKDGQTISKANYGVLNFTKKRTKNHYSDYFQKRAKDSNFFVRFLRELMSS